MRQVIKNMMHPDFKLRPSAKQLLTRPFIRQIECSRRWKIRAKRSVKLAKNLINWFVKTFILICYPFKYLYKKLTKSPNIEPSRAINLLRSDIDSNYSDDDSCDTSIVNNSNHSKLTHSGSDSGGTMASISPISPISLNNSFDLVK